MANNVSSNFAQSTFLQRDKKDTMIADTYGGAKEAISEYSKSINTAMDSINNEVTKFFKEHSYVKKILDSIDFDKPFFGLKVEDAMDALQGLGLDKGTIDSLKKLYGDHSLSNIASVLAGVTGVKMFSELGDIYAYVEQNEIKSISSFLNVVNKLTGLGLQVDGFSNMFETVGFVIDMADKWGLTDVAEKIMEKYKKEPKFKQTMINQLEVYVSTANLKMINICLDAGISPSSARVRCPYAEKMILGAYTIPSNTPISSYGEEGRRLIDTINRFANAFPKVQVCLANNSPYYGFDLSLFNIASEHAIRVLSEVNKDYDEYFIASMIGKSYSSVDMYNGTIGLYK